LVTEPNFFPGSQRLDVQVAGVAFSGVTVGAGQPVLMLHGFPQTHIAWRKVAPALAQRFRLIIPDLPGYGASRTLEAMPRWTKRRVAEALVALMQHLGHERFAVVGHDRGARAGYRLALDHPEQVTAFASLTVIPTLDALEAIDYLGANKAFHWFFLAQEGDLPERMLAAAPDAFIQHALTTMTEGRDVLEAAAVDAYRNAFRDPSVRHAMCEDYRAGLAQDLDCDMADRAAGRTLACPVLTLWPRSGQAPERPTPLEIWQRWAPMVSGTSTNGGHLQAEEAPQEVLAALLPFLAQHVQANLGS